MRNSELIRRRDRNLVAKFHELYDIQRKRIDDAIRETGEVFYLDETYVYKRIFYNTDNKQYYDQLVQQAK